MGIKRYDDFLNEGIGDDRKRGVIERSNQVNKLLKGNLNLTLELHNEGKAFLYQFYTPLDINVVYPWVSYEYKISFDDGKTFKNESKQRDLNDEFQINTLLEDLDIIYYGIQNEQDGYATDITDPKKLIPINKVQVNH